MFHTAGIVVLTVCINSITMPKVVEMLGLHLVEPSKQLIYERAITTLQNTGEFHLKTCSTIILIIMSLSYLLNLTFAIIMFLDEGRAKTGKNITSTKYV